jgi:2'-5' RNA ligase
MSRFFIALLPAQEIQEYAKEIKQYFADKYSCHSAKKSPPHITLQPPFEWADNFLATLETSLEAFAIQQQSIPIIFDGFAAFPPRVIYINVIKCQPLLTLQTNLITYTETNLGIIDKVEKTRPFIPHLTVAFRDLTKQNFRLAWPEFVQRHFYAQCTVTHLTLLVHDGNCWNIQSKFPFLSPVK